jgi:hypothetical protein
MRIVKTQKPEKLSDIRVVPQDGGDHLPAWVEIETGRYQPRRIRGSFRGRELG